MLILATVLAFAGATALVLAGFFTLLATTYTQGRLKTFGRVIAVWTFVFAAGMVFVAWSVPIAASHHRGGHFRHMGPPGPPPLVEAPAPTPPSTTPPT